MSVWREIKSPIPSCRAFSREVHDGHLTLFVGREPIDTTNKWHLSISHRYQPGNPTHGRLPTWDEIKEARYTFCPDEVYMAMILPPRAEYVNVHPTTMHLHEVNS
jgi:hypothetical protein